MNESANELTTGITYSYIVSMYDTIGKKYVSMKNAGLEMANNNRLTFEGSMSALWYEKDGGSKSLDRNTELFNMVFDIKGTLNGKLPISMTSSITESKAYNSNLQQVAIELKTGDEVSGIQSTELAGNVNIYPNPFTDRLMIEFTLDKDETVEIEMVDISGRVIESLVVEGKQGENTIEWNITDKLTNGMYVARLSGNSINHVIEVNCIK